MNPGSASAAKATKASKLRDYEARANKAGWIVPPFEVLSRNLKEEDITRVFGKFKSICHSDGPLGNWVFIRNNGKPQGTGEGVSRIVRLDLSEKLVKVLANRVIKSDPQAEGVMFQPVVGQSFHIYYWFTPFVSGIAYTPECSERKNAIVEWVYGHPALAVEGGGRYVAFNKKTLKEEVEYIDLSMQDNIKVVALREPEFFPGYSFGNEFASLRTDKHARMGFLEEMFREIVENEGKRELFKKLFEAVLKIGEHGPLYLEWAATSIYGQVKLFALQISEFEGKLAGLPTLMAGKLLELVRDAQLPENTEFRNLKALYGKAVEDPHVFAVGFDVVGKHKKEFDTMIWMPNGKQLKRGDIFLASTSLLVWDCGPVTTRDILSDQFGKGMMVGGIVEWTAQAGDVHPFRGHFGEYCRRHSIPGLGNIQRMEDKLYALFPSGFKEGPKHWLLIKGKFVLEVDESIPFGTLKVLEVKDVRKLD